MHDAALRPRLHPSTPTRRATTHPAVAWLAATLLGTFGIAAPARSSEPIVAEPAAVLPNAPAPDRGTITPGPTRPADPAVSRSYPCHYTTNVTWPSTEWREPVRGQIRFPSATCRASDGPPAGRPVVVFTHGNGMQHTDHRHLMVHLARNGFVTVSIANDGSNEDRARQIISMLDAVHQIWTWRHRVSGVVALAGHSRGGEGATTAARMLEEDGLGALPYDVRAVIAIAPTDGGPTLDPQPRETLTGRMTTGYLAIHGSRDNDVQGSSALHPNVEIPKTAFAAYDRAGSEASNEGFQFVGTHVDRAFVFLRGFGHRDFLDDGLFGATSAGRAVAKAYFHAFLRWQVWRDERYRGFFDGRWRPESLADLDLVQQISSGPRRVLDNFENRLVGSTSLGGQVFYSASSFAAVLEGPLWQLLGSSPHQTGGLVVIWRSSGHRWIRWSLPEGSILGAGAIRDLRGYSHLSLRVAQLYASSFNTPGVDQDFHVQILSGSGFSNMVRIGLYGRIPYPLLFECDNLFSSPPCRGNFTKSAMTTIRVPRSAFHGVDWSDVRFVFLFFGRGDTISTGAITLDSLELDQGPIETPVVFADGFESGDLVAWSP